MKSLILCMLVAAVSTQLFTVSTAPPTSSVQSNDLSNSDTTTTEQNLDLLQKEMQKKWPENRVVRFVFHGHSVPAGYFKTPEVRTFDSYPSLFHRSLCEHFSTAVIDVGVTAIGGETSQQGAKRFTNDVLCLKPDVVFLDYSLNDRRIGLVEADNAWRSMIEAAQAKRVLIVLLTPTPDSSEDLLDNQSPLAQHSLQVQKLATEYKIPLVNSRAKFQRLVESGAKVDEFLSQPNHPNRAGHQVVADEIIELFTKQR